MKPGHKKRILGNAGKKSVGRNAPVFSGKLLRLYVKKVRLPHGHVATFEIIKHPGAALIVPFLSADKVIMLRQLRPVINSYIYELPAGTLGKNEPPLACARREMIEETGYSAGSLKFLGAIYPVPGYSTEKIFIYKAGALKKRECAAEADEVIRTGVFTKAEIKRLFKSGRVVDAKTIAAFAMCGWL
jgi:ADP-ribose pyrophosphatase